MDIALASIGLSQARVANQAGIMIMKKAMDTAAQQNESLQVLLASAGAGISAEPHLGQSVDISI